MKKTLFALATAAVFTLATAAVQAETVIKFSHVVAENTPKGQMANKFKELVEANDKLKDFKVEVYPNSQLFNDNNVLEAMVLGDVQIAAPSLSKFGKYTKQLQIYDLPFLFPNMEAVEKFQQGEAGQNLLKAMEDKGFLGLGYLHNGLKQMSASKALKAPTDAKGLKFRIQSSDVLAAQFEAVEAVPVKKPFSEVFTLLQTKAIDGQENTWSNIYSKKFFEVQPYITESNHGLLDYMVVTSAEFWNGLDDTVRAEMDKAMADALAHGNKVAAEKAEADKKAIADSGRSEILQLSADDRAQWVEAMKPVWEKFKEDVGADTLEAAIKAGE